jgi:flagellar L-ring protein precursor FlgH
MERRKVSVYAVITGTLIGLSGCRTFDRLMEINEVPPMSQIMNPVAHPNYRPVTMPMPDPEPVELQNNSLWKTGAKTFFKDQRAKRVGDILTVIIDMNDSASISNETKTNRQSTQTVAVNNFMGFEEKFSEVLPKGVDPTKLIGVTSDPNLQGKGSIQRSEKVQFKLAATITQILPNGNFVISGRQEMRINYEIREIVVVGIVRPEDISSANTVPYEKISEARMAYSGRGQLDDVQQAPWAQQILTTISPF